MANGLTVIQILDDIAADETFAANDTLFIPTEDDYWTTEENDGNFTMIPTPQPIINPAQLVALRHKFLRAGVEIRNFETDADAMTDEIECRASRWTF